MQPTGTRSKAKAPIHFSSDLNNLFQQCSDMRIDKLSHTIFRAGHLGKRHNLKHICDLNEDVALTPEGTIGRFSYHDHKENKQPS